MFGGANEEYRKALSGHRPGARWEVELLDEQDRVLRTLGRMVDGSFELAPFERLGGAANLILHEELEWLRHRVRFVYHPGVPGVDPWPVGTYLFEAPVRHVDRYGIVKYEAPLLTKLVVPDEDCLDDYLTVKAGDNLVDAAVTLLESTGETAISVTRSSLTARTAMTFEPGTSKLTVINDILTSAGYFSLQVDGMGVFQVVPYVAPEDRAPVWEFVGDEYDVMVPEYRFDQDIVGIPNKAIVVSPGDDEKPGLVGVAKNEDPDSEYSFVGRGGRCVTRTYEADAATQTVVTDLAKRRLADAMSPVAHWEVTHAIIPIRGHDVVVLADRGQAVRVSLQRYSVSGFDITQLVSAVYRVGVDIDDGQSGDTSG